MPTVVSPCPEPDLGLRWSGGNTPSTVISSEQPRRGKRPARPPRCRRHGGVVRLDPDDDRSLAEGVTVEIRRNDDDPAWQLPKEAPSDLAERDRPARR